MQADVDYANVAGFGYSFIQTCINPVTCELSFSANGDTQTQAALWPQFDYLYFLGDKAQVLEGCTRVTDLCTA
jgi:hypothetical protein